MVKSFSILSLLPHKTFCDCSQEEEDGSVDIFIHAGEEGELNVYVVGNERRNTVFSLISIFGRRRNDWVDAN